MMYRLVVIASVFVASCAQMLLKRATQRKHAPFWSQYLNFWVIGGYALLLGSLLVNVFCLGKGVLVKEVSVIESLSLLFVPALSWMFFREPITWRKIVAMGLVVAGTVVFFLSPSGGEEKIASASRQRAETDDIAESGWSARNIHWRTSENRPSSHFANLQSNPSKRED